MLTLSNYDGSQGDAAAIYVENVSQVIVKTAQGVDETARLVAAGILFGETTDDAIVETFGESWADVARYALEIKTNPDTPL